MHGNWRNSIGLVAALTLIPLCGLAQEAPDSDGDGFSDFEEQVGLNLAPGLQLPDPTGGGVSFLPSCVESGLPRSECLDPSSPDLFAILVPASPSALPQNPLGATSAPAEEGGLGVTVHVLVAADPAGDRVVSLSSPQKAVRIAESLSAPGEAIGFANYGTPNGLDGSVIWTTRIAEFVASACESDALCQTSGGAMGLAAVTEALTRWVLNHEVGHLFSLTADYNSRFGGYHLKAGEDEVLTQFVDYDTARKTGLTTFQIPQTYSDQSRADKRLQ